MPIVLISCIKDNSPLQKSKEINCDQLQQDFDYYLKKSELPFYDNPHSLCFGLSMNSNFSQLEPKWAVGKLVNISKESPETQTLLFFQGVNKQTYTVYYSLSDEEAAEYVLGNYYKLDMMNICRYWFSGLSSLYLSPILDTFVKPEEIGCSTK